MYELGGTGEVLLIAHATGLCGAMYQQVADELTDSFRVVGFDFRGHGNSCESSNPDLAWERMADDVLAVTEAISAPDRACPIHAFGHSMGGSALLLAQARNASAFRSIFVFEPIIFPDDFSSEDQLMMAESARRRRVEFPSRADVLYRYARKPPFNQVHAGFLASYVENGFADQPNGSVRLKCSPEAEATIFVNGRATRLGNVQHIACPSAVAIGQEDRPGPAHLGPRLADVLTNGRLVRYPHIGHFGPFQDPWTVARDITQHALDLA
jgi:pimeloyl-ACP methyl ester carboxylesterase